MERVQKQLILRDLAKKIVFIVGPRQVGKTWLSKDIARSYKHPVYLNYDRLEDRKIIKDEAWLEETDLLIFDELHKMPDWKNFLKGVYDTKPNHLNILVTGSARLDLLRQAGDSLAGRFYRHRLMPFSPAELRNQPVGTDINLFLERGGFPEPFLAESTVDADRWRMQYIDGLIRTDILDFEKIHDFKAVQIVLEILRNRVGSPVSYSSIAEDAQISPNTVKKYIQIFEALYIIFRVTPFAKNIGRSLLKEPKIYFFDAGMVKGDAGIRFENFTAICLLKHIYSKVDYEGKNTELHYLRTKDGLEVDFCLTSDNSPKMICEVKYSDSNINKSLFFFHEKYHIPSVQVVKDLKHERKDRGITVRRGIDFLKELAM